MTFFFVVFMSMQISAQNTININEQSSQSQISLRSSNLPFSVGKDLKGVSKQRYFQYNKQLMSLNQKNKGDILLLDFFEGKQYKAAIKNVRKNKNGLTSITGKIENTEFGYCYIVISDDGITISAELPETDEVFIASTKSGVSYLFQSSLSARRENELPGSEPLIPTNLAQLRTSNDEDQEAIFTIEPEQPPFTAAESINDDVVIDLMMVYTPAAEAWANSSSSVTDMAHLIALALEISNEIMDNSETGITFREVHTHKTNYIEVNSEVDLDRITYKDDNYMDEVHDLRDQYNADIVVFIPLVEFTGGLAWLLNSENGFSSGDRAFALSRVQQTASSYTVVHEIGHNMGCTHHRLQGDNPGLYPYSYGWRGTTTSGTKYATVMTYESGQYFPDGQNHTRIPYFSDPDKTFEGDPIGSNEVNNEANNTLTLKKTKHVTSRYRVAAIDNADLVSITLSEGNLNPAFSQTVSNYTVKVPPTTTQITISGQKSNPSSTLTGEVTNYQLNTGENTIELTVTAQSGTKRIYTITVIRLEPLPDALWIKQNADVTTTLNDIQMIDETTGYICGNSGVILKTTDGGKNWVKQTSTTTVNLNDILFLDSNTGYAVGANGTILKTINGGANWSLAYSNGSLGPVYGIFAESASEMWLMCNNGLYTYNGDATVTPTGETNTQYDMCKPNEGTLAFGAWTNGIIYTKNKTDYWAINVAPPSARFYGIATYPGTNIVIACSNGGGLQRADFTPLNPAQVSLVSTVTNDLKDVTFASSNTVYSVGGAGTIIKSIDQGDFWTNITPTSLNTQNLEAVSFPSETKGWVVGANGTILQTMPADNIPATNALPATGISCDGFTANWDAIVANLSVQYEVSVYYYAGMEKMPVAGSPITVTSGTSKGISGLTLGTDYFYTVKTIIGGYESANSNEIQVTLPSATIFWSGVTSSDWETATNWSGGVVPGQCSDVVIPATANYYPVISTPTTINNIIFEPGAEIGNQHLLNYQEATVQYGLTTGRWNQITTPIETTIGSSFHFNRAPSTWVQTFAAAGVNAGWRYVTSLNHSFNIGDGFVFWIAGNKENHPFSITGDLAGENISKTLDFINGGVEGSFASVGNPFMSTIDFGSLVTSNPNVIGDSYLIWIEEGENAGYAGYNTSVGGDYGLSVSLDQYIAPLQSFIVEKGTGTGNLNFSAAIQTAGAGNGLRALEDRSNKLDIIAENEIASVLTFIANRANGRDSHKLFSEMSSVPDVYTLKEKTALGAHIINTDDILIPIGLSTTYSGNMSLTFNGMNNYNAKISFIDIQGETIDISNQPTYTYSFDYIPSVNENEEVVPSESRFFIQLSSASMTSGVKWDNASENASIYAKDNSIYVVSTSSNPIKQVIIYNTQGQVLHANDQLNSSAYTINRLENTEICIVKVVTENGTQNKKLIINN